jgi:hypothetical protein
MTGSGFVGAGLAKRKARRGSTIERHWARGGFVDVGIGAKGILNLPSTKLLHGHFYLQYLLVKNTT